MKRSLFTAPRLLAAVAVLLLISSLCPPGAAAAISGPPRHLLEMLLGLGTAPLNRVGAALRGRPPLTVEAAQIQANFLAYVQANKSLEMEVQRLRGQLELARVITDDPNVRQRFANVASATTRGGYPILTIYHDPGDGLTPGMVVAGSFADAYGSCLVGRLADVGTRTATVELITARRNLTVVTGPARAGDGRRHGDPMQIKVEPNGRTFSTIDKASTSIVVGDLAFLADTTWPPVAQGRIVGKVILVEPLRTDPLFFRHVVIEPIYDLSALTQVTVLIPGAAANR